MLKLSQK